MHMYKHIHTHIYKTLKSRIQVQSDKYILSSPQKDQMRNERQKVSKYSVKKASKTIDHRGKTTLRESPLPIFLDRFFKENIRFKQLDTCLLRNYNVLMLQITKIGKNSSSFYIHPVILLQYGL